MSEGGLRGCLREVLVGAGDLLVGTGLGRYALHRYSIAGPFFGKNGRGETKQGRGEREGVVMHARHIQVCLFWDMHVY